MPLFGRRRRISPFGNPANVRRSRNALTSSGFRVTHQDTDVMRRLIQPWQSRAFAYYDQLGEINYAAQFYARMLSPLVLFAAEKDDAGDVVETTNPEAVAALERIQDPGGGRSGLLSSYGRLMFLAGECYLFVTRDPDTGDEQWEMLSTDELRIQSGIYIRYKAPSLIAEEFHESKDDETQEGAWVAVDDDTAVAYRLWQRHPRFSMLADSTMKGVLDLCEELLLLTQAVRARARSRLAGSGILFFDERISPAPLEPAPDEDPQEDPFLSELTQAMTLPIVDEGAASQVVPLTVRVPSGGDPGSKVSDMVYHLQIIDPTQLYPETGLRTECIDRIAIGLDMPPEILKGLEDSNHWTAWQIDEQTWKSHGQPKAQQLCDDLTAAYLRPYLRDVVGLADWRTYSIAFDATAIINHPDRTKDAKDLFDRVVIGKRALREASGFSEEDAPTEEERAERLGVLTHDSSLAWFGEPAPRGGTVETAPGVVVSDQTGNSAGTPTDSSGASSEGPPPAGPPNANENELVGSIVARLLGAVDLALLRAREVSGSRLRSLAKRDPESLALLNGVRNVDVAAKLGKTRTTALRAPSDRELIAGSHDLIADALRIWGIRDESIAEVICEHVERHAARTLYEKRPSPMPTAFTAYVTGLIAAAERKQ